MGKLTHPPEALQAPAVIAVLHAQRYMGCTLEQLFRCYGQHVTAEHREHLGSLLRDLQAEERVHLREDGRYALTAKGALEVDANNLMNTASQVLSEL